MHTFKVKQTTIAPKEKRDAPSMKSYIKAVSKSQNRKQKIAQYIYPN